MQCTKLSSSIVVEGRSCSNNNNNNTTTMTMMLQQGDAHALVLSIEVYASPS